MRGLWSYQRPLAGNLGWSRLKVRGARVLENVAAKNAMAMSTLTATVVPIFEDRTREFQRLER